MRLKLLAGTGLVLLLIAVFSVSATSTLPPDHPLSDWYGDAYVPPVHTGFYIYPEDRFHQGHGFLREPAPPDPIDPRHHPDYPHFHRDHPHLYDPQYHPRGYPHQQFQPHGGAAAYGQGDTPASPDHGHSSGHSPTADAQDADVHSSDSDDEPLLGEQAAAADHRALHDPQHDHGHRYQHARPQHRAPVSHTYDRRHVHERPPLVDRDALERTWEHRYYPNFLAWEHARWYIDRRDRNMEHRVKIEERIDALQERRDRQVDRMLARNR